MEKVVQVKTCKHCQSLFNITDKDLEFYEKISPSFWWKKYSVPTPTLCPDCRNQRRLSWRNEQNLYRRKCSYTKKDIISMYSPDKDLIVYDKDYWNSDKWDVMDYWLDIDFWKSFFEQFIYLLYNTPIPSLTITYDSENSDYQVYSWKMKNCYMISASWDCENTMYSTRLIKTVNVFDSIDSTWLERCYQIINSENCYACLYVINSSNSQNCLFSYDLTNCSNCILCNNLVWKSYCIENIQYSKDEYETKSKKLKIELLWKWWNPLNKILKWSINRDLMMIWCEDSVWDNLKNCKNCINCFHFEESENCKYSENGWMWCYNSYDWRWVWENLYFGYEILDTWINATTNCFSISCYTNDNIYYCINCHNSSNLFGCLWLKNKSYCIFNKQYTKEQYEELVPKIIENMIHTWDWWEFFPSKLSPFWYNETAAMEYLLLNQKDAINQWFNWLIYQQPLPKVQKTINANKLPNNIDDIPDDILNRAIECEISKKPFKIVRQELDFYKKNNIPIPKRHPSIRHIDRIDLSNPKKIFDRKCDKCWINIKTTYSPDREEKVYCEKCYNNEVY